MQTNWKSWTLGDMWTAFVAHCPIKIDWTAARNLFHVVAGAAQSGLLALKPQDTLGLLPPSPLDSDPEVITIDLAAIDPPPVAIASPPVRRPWHRRTAEVQAILAEAWAAGITTYTRLLAIVRDRTGKICSRRAVARFKREHGLR